MSFTQTIILQRESGSVQHHCHQSHRSEHQLLRKELTDVCGPGPAYWGSIDVLVALVWLLSAGT